MKVVVVLAATAAAVPALVVHAAAQCFFKSHGALEKKKIKQSEGRQDTDVLFNSSSVLFQVHRLAPSQERPGAPALGGTRTAPPPRRP